MQERVALELLALLEEINKAGPHVLLLLGHEFRDLLDSLPVADNSLGIAVLLLESVNGILVYWLFDSLAVADKCLGIVVLPGANVIGIRISGLLEAREGVDAVVVHGGLGGGHAGGHEDCRHFYF